jgi:hypothetical protein
MTETAYIVRLEDTVVFRTFNKDSLNKFIKNWKEKHTTTVTIEEYYLHPASAITKLSSEEWK